MTWKPTPRAWAELSGAVVLGIAALWVLGDGFFTWRRELFRWMQRNSPSAAEYFKLPPARVIELGTQISI